MPRNVYTWGPDGLISKRALNTSTSHWYEFGPQGETRALTDSSGNVTDTYYYNAYGVPITSTGSTLNPFRYGGKYGYYWDEKTGLILAGFRWYSPHLMRWLSRDPIGYEGGVNLYGYVEQNPVNYIDPDGLDGLRMISNAAAGFGDSISFGITRSIRRALTRYLFNEDKEVVDYDSWSYRVGDMAGIGFGCSAAGAGAITAKGYRFRFMFHGPHHYFPELGRRSRHFEILRFRKGVRNSHKKWQFPF